MAAAPGWAEVPSLAELEWIDRGVDPVDALTRSPAECAEESTDTERKAAIRLGRVAFRSPALLGGLAARVGMSCNSCHPNGHANRGFHIMGVSGEAGTVDVTGSVFSTNRDDGRFNPIKIPSLVDVALESDFGTASPTPHLERFVRSVIVDEFQGQDPSPPVLDALLAYLSSLRRSACPAPGSDSAIEAAFEADARGLRDSLESLLDALRKNDSGVAVFALLSHRAGLERLYRRFPESVSARVELLDLGRSFGALRKQMEVSARNPRVRQTVEAALRRQDVLIERLREQIDDSYYDPARLRKAIVADLGSPDAGRSE